MMGASICVSSDYADFSNQQKTATRRPPFPDFDLIAVISRGRGRAP
jgi:hypothetical protein